MGKRIDMAGMRFGLLTVIKESGRTSYGKIQYLCKCDCGNEIVVTGNRLQQGVTKSCGCLKHRTGPGFKDLTGKRFGRLTVIKRVQNQGRATRYECICDCGNHTFVKGSNLTQGKQISCGCAHHKPPKNKTHGLKNTRLYNVWLLMKNRCYNQKSLSFPDYGGRGITVCDEWIHDFQAFHDWAFSHGYNENAPKGQCTIDRINNDEGYKPDNCRWVDRKVQNNNRRKRRWKVKPKEL